MSDSWSRPYYVVSVFRNLNLFFLCPNFNCLIQNNWGWPHNLIWSMELWITKVYDVPDHTILPDHMLLVPNHVSHLFFSCCPFPESVPAFMFVELPEPKDLKYLIGRENRWIVPLNISKMTSTGLPVQSWQLSVLDWCLTRSESRHLWTLIANFSCVH